MQTTRPCMLRPGFSMVGMLVTMVCMVVMFAILMSSLNKAITGEGSAVEGTVRSFQDELHLTSLFQSMFTRAQDRRGEYVVPSVVSGSEDIAEDTTANLYSVMVMERFASPKQLVSANEYSGYVEEDPDYDYLVYDPKAGVFWDPTFRADLNRESNVSFAHMPLFGERFDAHWRTTMSSSFPLFGNRGPKNGVHDPNSWTYGRNSVWGGHLVFGDGHLDFVNSFTPNGIFFEQNGARLPDNIFNMDLGPQGGDAILSFTKSMSNNGPELQYD